MRNREKRLSTYVPPQPEPEPQTEEKQQPNQKRLPESAPEPDED